MNFSLSTVRVYYAQAPAGLRAVGLILATTICFSSMHGAVRHVAGGYLDGGLHPFEVVFFRNVFGLFVLFPWFARVGLGPLRTQRLGMHALRCLIQTVAMILFFTALSLAPLAEVSALSFSAPLFASLGAILFLGERVRVRRCSALVLGFCGALVILRPGFEAINPGHLLVVFASGLWAGAILVIKSLSRTESSLTMTAYMGLLITPLSFLPALLVWQWPSGEQLAWLAAIGALGGVAHLAMAQALKEADATAVLPFDFTRLIWATIIGYLAFAELPDFWTWVGAAIIFASTTYIVFREAKLKVVAPQEAAATPPRAPS